MARSLKEIQSAIETFDEEYIPRHWGKFDVNEWKAARKPLIDELEAWHALSVEDRN